MHRKPNSVAVGDDEGNKPLYVANGYHVAHVPSPRLFLALYGLNFD